MSFIKVTDLSALFAFALRAYVAENDRQKHKSMEKPHYDNQHVHSEVVQLEKS